VLSRVAESLYWIGRYVERAEQTARMADVAFSHTLAMGSTPAAEDQRRRHWDALLEILGEPVDALGDGVTADERTVPAHVTYSADNDNAIVHCIATARENARTLRHQLAPEMWEVLNRFHLDVQRPTRRRRVAADAEHTIRFCRSVVEFSQLFQGVTDSTMPREEGWHFLQAGTYLERAEKTARALAVNYRLLVGQDDVETELLTTGRAALDPQPWASVLRSLSAYEAYYRVSSTSVQPGAVIELLTLSPVVPRSIRFSIDRLDHCLSAITETGAAARDGAEPHALRNEARREVARLDGELAYQRLDELVRRGVHDSLLDLQRRCYWIGSLIEEEFFAHRPLTAEEVVA
jgi:uncharacterized alpha-E superfamily protein